MDPETLTLHQIIKTLRPKHLFAIITSLAPMIYAGYWFGQNISESKARAEASELKNKILQLEIEQSASHKKISDISTTSLQWQQAYKELEGRKNSTTTNESKAQGNCDFVRKKITETQRDIERPSLAAIYGSGTSTEEEISRKSVLEHRLEGYIKQLSTCDK